MSVVYECFSTYRGKRAKGAQTGSGKPGVPANATTCHMKTKHNNRPLALVLAALALSLSGIQPAQAAAWTTNSPMITARYGHTVTLLPNGKLLAAGGCSTNFIPSLNYLSTAELYDPANGTWTVTGSQAAPRVFHTATLLPSGQPAAGARSIPSLNYLSTAELYDAANGTWSVTGSQAAPRVFHTATLLPSGKVLIVGGYGSSGGLLSSAGLYDPASGTWPTTCALATAREYHTATLLPNGKVLVVGGETNNQIILGNNSLASAELYDPATGRWTATGALDR